jgi:hypothetical protein
MNDMNSSTVISTGNDMNSSKSGMNDMNSSTVISTGNDMNSSKSGMNDMNSSKSGMNYTDTHVAGTFATTIDTPQTNSPNHLNSCSLFNQLKTHFHRKKIKIEKEKSKKLKLEWMLKNASKKNRKNEYVNDLIQLLSNV